jgi:hypothetical protein
VEALTERQTVGRHVAPKGSDIDVGSLVDTLRVRLGPERVFRLTPVESDIPERSVKRIAALAPPNGASWPPELPRPARLLTPPEPVTAAAEIPDSPPLFFVWRNIRHGVVKADGPERILGEWWVSNVDIGMQRDYYRVGCHAFRARRVAVGAPRRHRALPGSLNAAVRVDAGGQCEFSRTSVTGPVAALCAVMLRFENRKATYADPS